MTKLNVPVLMTEAEFEQHQEEFNGVCLACGEIHDGDTEDDARGRECLVCGLHRVYGMGEALLAGGIGIVDLPDRSDYDDTGDAS